MNNYYVMTAPREDQYRQQAAMITAAFAALMLLLMFLLKWDLPALPKIIQDPCIEVELNLPY